jgi:hypothetical protein
MSTGISANRMEILQIADAVAREKSIDKEIVSDGTRAAKGRPLALRRRARHPRHHRPEDRRDGAEARHDGGGR